MREKVVQISFVYYKRFGIGTQIFQTPCATTTQNTHPKNQVMWKLLKESKRCPKHILYNVLCPLLYSSIISLIINTSKYFVSGTYIY